MKALLFVPEVYSLAEMLSDGFHDNGWEAKVIDYKTVISHRINKLYEKTSGLPRKLTKYWKAQYYKLINKRYQEIFNEEKPEIVLIYNNQFIYPETISQFKRRAKVVFLLGDNPLWSNTFDFNLAILKYADLVLCPDSHWQFELSLVGIPNVVCDYIGYSKRFFFPVPVIAEDLKKIYDCDLLFIGRNYSGSSGYKRAMFLDSLTGLNLKVFGTKEWEHWLPYFPSLKPHFNATKSRISQEELNFAINCAKICPIDQNTGIINGLHLRIFESIGSGTLPIVEWRRDIDEVFGGLLPVIKRYSEAKEIANYYLQSDVLRRSTIETLRNHIETKYTPKCYVKRILDRMELNKVNQ
jgi:hypothetical protein